jgi:hypothetical protein
MKSSSLLLPSSLVLSEHPVPSAACPFQFLICYSVFFWWVGVSLSRGICWFILRVAVGVLRAAYLLTCSSASPKQIWSWHLVTQEPSWFLSVMWHGEALCRLGVQVVRVFSSSWWYFSAKFGSSISARFLIFSSHTVCFRPRVTILDLLKNLIIGMIH